MRFVVYGAGAVGGVVATRLAEAGVEVGVVARGPHLAAIRADGLRRDTATTSTTVRLPAADSVAGLSPWPDDVVLVAVKSQHTPAVIDDLRAHAPAAITVASLQNGVANERRLLRTFKRVLGVCVMLPATHLEPGVVLQASEPVPGILDVGRAPHGTDPAATDVAAAVRAAGFVSEVRPDVMAWKYRKLLLNVGNAVQAACAVHEESDAAARELADRARAEAEHVLVTAGVPLVGADEDAARRGDLLQTAAARGRGGGSTWQSLARGAGEVETDFINGEVCLLGREHDVPTPVNDLLRRTLARMARERTPPATLSAADLLARL